MARDVIIRKYGQILMKPLLLLILILSALTLYTQNPNIPQELQEFGLLDLSYGQLKP